MSSYVYMKILESQPRRYDRGLAMLSLGHADRVKERLVAENVRLRDRVLEVGCGTGTVAVLAARAGAAVTAFDVSAAMLEVAREKVAVEGLGDRVELEETSISGMDHYPDESFDVVISTLVFSELSPDEQGYVLDHAYRILGSGGRLALADEARPRTVWMRLLHGLLRVPLLVLTFALTQTSTRAVRGLAARVRRAGFIVETEERTALDSFLYLVAVKEGAG